MVDEPKTMRMQTNRQERRPGALPLIVAETAYEVYAHLYGHSQSLARMGERGGFSAGEVIALLYARTFPRSEWRVRMDEALRGLVT